MTNLPIQGGRHGDLPVKPDTTTNKEHPGSNNDLNVSSGLEKNNRGEELRSMLAEIAHYVTIGEWRPSRAQRFAVLEFQGMIPALFKGPEDLRARVVDGKAVFPSGDPELAGELTKRFVLAVENLANYFRQEPLTIIPNTIAPLEGATKINCSSKEYKGELLTSLWLVKTGFTKAISCPDLLKQFNDQVNKVLPSESELRVDLAKLPFVETKSEDSPLAATTPAQLVGQAKLLLLAYAVWGNERAERLEEASDRLMVKSQIGRFVSTLGMDAEYKIALNSRAK